LAEREREKQVDGPNLIGCWMVAGSKAQPIGSHQVCFKKNTIDVSQRLLMFVLQIQ
jgi:hypothetical protein